MNYISENLKAKFNKIFIKSLVKSHFQKSAVFVEYLPLITNSFALKCQTFAEGYITCISFMAGDSYNESEAIELITGEILQFAMKEVIRKL